MGTTVMDDHFLNFNMDITAKALCCLTAVCLSMINILKNTLQSMVVVLKGILVATCIYTWKGLLARMNQFVHDDIVPCSKPD